MENFDFYILDDSNQKDVHIKKFEKREEAFEFLVNRGINNLQKKGAKVYLEDVEDIKEDVKKKLSYDSKENDGKSDSKEFYDDDEIGRCIGCVVSKDKEIDYVSILSYKNSSAIVVANKKELVDYFLKDASVKDFIQPLDEKGQYLEMFINGKKVTEKDLETEKSKREVVEKMITGTMQVKQAIIVNGELKKSDETLKANIVKPRTFGIRDKLAAKVNGLINGETKFESSPKKKADRQPLTEEERKTLKMVKNWATWLDDPKWFGLTFDSYKNLDNYYKYRQNEQEATKDLFDDKLVKKLYNPQKFDELKHRDFVNIMNKANNIGFERYVKDAKERIALDLLSHMDVSFSNGKPSFVAYMNVRDEDNKYKQNVQKVALGNKPEEVYDRILKTADAMFWNDKSSNCMYNKEQSKSEDARSYYHRASNVMDNVFHEVATKNGVKDRNMDGVNRYNPFSERAGRMEVSFIYPRKLELTPKFVTQLSQELTNVRIKHKQEGLFKPDDNAVSIVVEQKKSQEKSNKMAI